MRSPRSARASRRPHSRPGRTTSTRAPSSSPRSPCPGSTARHLPMARRRAGARRADDSGPPEEHIVSNDASQTAETPASAEDLLPTRHTPAQRVQHLLHGNPALSPLIVLVVAVIVFGIFADNFLRPQALSLLVQQVAVVAALAVGQTVILLTAGIARGLLTGLLNGVLVTRLNLPPFIVTLGTFSIFTAVSLLYAAGQTIALGPDAFLVWTGKTISIGSVSITWGVILMLLLYAGVGFALRNTAWGRHLYATGDDREASQLAGIATDRVLLSAYVVAGFTVGIAAWIVCGRVGGADPNAGLNYNLQSITAVVIGGTSLFGGRGLVIGSLIGALIVQVFNSGLALAGVDPNYQVLATGVLVILAVSVDQWIRRVKA